jgi:hypothetical protein
MTEMKYPWKAISLTALKTLAGSAMIMMPSPMLIIFSRDGRPVYSEQWKILGYSRKRTNELTKKQIIPSEAQKN